MRVPRRDIIPELFSACASHRQASIAVDNDGGSFGRRFLASSTGRSEASKYYWEIRFTTRRFLADDTFPLKQYFHAEKKMDSGQINFVNDNDDDSNDELL